MTTGKTGSIVGARFETEDGAEQVAVMPGISLNRFLDRATGFHSIRKRRAILQESRGNRSSMNKGQRSGGNRNGDCQAKA